jgi:acyl carrier protein
MPVYSPKPVSFWEKALGSFVLLLIFISLCLLIYKAPWILALIAAFAVWAVFSLRKDKQELKRLADERENEGICTFARSFERKYVDTWIIRAVHEELQKDLGYPDIKYSIRATDRFEEDLKIDVEDLDDLLVIIAQRTGRSIEGTEKNPYYDKVKTVGDMVLFINSQPKLNT